MNEDEARAECKQKQGLAEQMARGMSNKETRRNAYIFMSSLVGSANAFSNDNYPPGDFMPVKEMALSAVDHGEILRELIDAMPGDADARMLRHRRLDQFNGRLRASNRLNLVLCVLELAICMYNIMLEMD